MRMYILKMLVCLQFFQFKPQNPSYLLYQLLYSHLQVALLCNNSCGVGGGCLAVLSQLNTSFNCTFTGTD